MINFYNLESMKDSEDIREDNPNFRRHEMHLSKHFILCGPTGIGKTNALLNLMMTLDNCFSDVQIYTADPNEKLYKGLKKNNKEFVLEKLDKIPLLDEQRQNRMQKLIIFDDFISKTKDKGLMDKLIDYAIRGRKLGFTCVFITQSFFKLDITIRNNCRYLILLKIGNAQNFNNIVSRMDTEVDPVIIKKVIRNATEHELNIALIDMQSRDTNKMMRKNFGLDYYRVVDQYGNTIDPVMKTGSGIIN